MSKPEARFGHEAEQAVLGAMMLEQAAITGAILRLGVDDFSAEAHRVIFQTICDISADGLTVDPVLVCERLRGGGRLDQVGGGAYVAELIHKVQTVAHVDHYAQVVRDASLDRQIKAQFRKAWEDQSEESLKVLVDLRIAREGNAGGRIFDLREDVDKAIAEIMRRDVPVINTGFTRLDAIMGGTRPGELVTVGARTSGGKTSFMLRVATNMAQDGREVLFITAEEKETEIVARMLPQATDIPAYKFRSRTWNEYEEDKVRTIGADRISSLPMKIMSRGRIAMQDIRRAVLQSRCEVVFVDYLQRCRLPNGERESSQLYEFMADFKELCHDAGVVGWIGSQLDRERDMRSGERPKLRDFRGSSGIESESSICLLLWKPPEDKARESMDYVPPAEGCVRVEAIIAKARGGVADVAVDLDFKGELLRFAEAKMNSSTEERWT